MRKILLLGLLGIAVALLFIPTVAFAVTDDAEAGTLITAEGSDCNLNYTDAGGFSKLPIAVSGRLTIAVMPMYGFSGVAAANHLPSTPGTPVTYSYTVVNEGNHSDTYDLSLGALSLSPGAANWTAEIRNAGDTDTIEALSNLAEDASVTFLVKITPSSVQSESPDTSTGTVTVTVTTDASPIGIYSGANGNSYGGLATKSDETVTTINTGIMAMTKTATVDAPAEYMANKVTGGDHDAVPGAVITYTIMVSNEGAGDAKKVIIVDKVPNSTTGLHVGRTSNTVPHVTITAAGPTSDGWKAYWGSASASTHMTYEDFTGWTTIELTGKAGTVDATAVYVKFEKASVAATTEKAKTLTWGVTIK